jgi:hypothetical protein
MAIMYKIDGKPIDCILLDNYDDYSHMLSLVTKDYHYYFKASLRLQENYPFALQSIYSCLGTINNNENRTEAYRELSKFLSAIRDKANLNMEIIKARDNFYVREKPKIKSKRFRKRFAA